MSPSTYYPRQINLQGANGNDHKGIIFYFFVTCPFGKGFFDMMELKSLSSINYGREPYQMGEIPAFVG